jgi:hypothetical protein
MCLSALGAAAAGTSWPSLPLASASRPCSSAWGEAIRPPPPDPRDLRPPRQVSLSSRFGSLQPALPQRVCPRLPPSSDPARAPPPPVHHDGPYCSRATASVPLSRPAWSRPARQPGPLASAPRRKSSPPAAGAGSVDAGLLECLSSHSPRVLLTGDCRSAKPGPPPPSASPRPAHGPGIRQRFHGQSISPAGTQSPASRVRA